MNNLFLLVNIIVFLICVNYGFCSRGKGTAKGKNAADGQQSLKQKVNGTIPTKIPLECCECLCNGKDISNKTHLKANRVKRSGYGGFPSICTRCQRYPSTYFSNYCHSCVSNSHYATECAHCYNRATGRDYKGNPACDDRKLY
jgi:hypothetical protein